MSSRIADVSVCGAVAPYNELLGGKLVALLLASEEVRSAYQRRYSNQVSVIASQMAGRPISKPADLCILTTTSLYGIGSSQYNRLSVQAKNSPLLETDVTWKPIGSSLTGGYGTLHLGADTANAPNGGVRGEPAAAIADAWRRRWLNERSRRTETLAKLQELGPLSVQASLHPVGVPDLLGSGDGKPLHDDGPGRQP